MSLKLRVVGNLIWSSNATEPLQERFGQPQEFYLFTFLFAD